MNKELCTGEKKWLLLIIVGLLFGTTQRATGQKCNASFKAQVAGNVVSFTDTSTNLFNSPYLLQWDFGDSTYTINTATPKHTYAHSGTRDVKLIISSQSPYCYDSIIKKVVVGNGPAPECQAQFVYSSQYKNKTVQLKRDIKTGDLLSWNLRTATRNDTDFSHYYSGLVPFEPIKLVVANKTCKDSSSVFLFRNIPECRVNFDFKRLNDRPDSFQFFQSSISTSWLAQAEHRWSVEGNEKSSEISPNHKLSTLGTHLVCLEIKDDDIACSAKRCKNIKSCEARFESAVKSNNGYGYDFKNSSIGEDLKNDWGILGVILKDSLLKEPSVILPGPSNYGVNLIVKEGSKCVDTFKQAIVIPTDAHGCKADFSSKVVNNSVVLTNQSLTSGPALKYFWTFGDGATSDLPNPDHDYALQGEYPITLRVTNIEGSCTDSTDAMVNIDKDEKTCRAKFQLAVDTTLKYTLFAFDQSVNAGQYEWSFGDGNMSTIDHPRHDYESVGKYRLCVTILGKDGSCTDSYCDSFLVDTAGKIGWKKGFTLVVLPSEWLNTIDAMQESVDIYPVPFSEVLHISTSIANGKIEVFDISGKDMGIEIDILGNDTTIKTSDWPSGLYVIRIQNEETSTNYKIIKH